MALPPLAQLRDSRLHKLEQMRQLGLNPFPSTSSRSTYVQPIVAEYEAWEGKEVTVAGRLTSWRKQGGMAFGHILDQSGAVQLLLRRGAIAETDPATGALGFEHLAMLDVGDLVEARGKVGKSQRGEISIMVESFTILTKSLRPLPDKWSGLKDRETILRKRYLDIISEPQTGARFEAIGRMLFAIREFLYARGFLEFHTPVIQPQYGGGTAKPFRTRVNALGVDMYLSISHELYLKRLITAGFDKVFTIGRYFRNEGIDRSHHPEFAMVETMTAYENYEYNMDLIEDMFRHVAQKAFGRTVFKVRGHDVDFAGRWRRVSMSDAVLEATGIDFRAIDSVENANTQLAMLGVHDPQPSVGHALVRAFEEKVEKSLIQPTLVYGHPVEISPLAKPMASDRRFVERFEIFIAGMECGDNWSEQNDPVELLAAWRQSKQEDVEAGEAHPLDYDFLECLEHGLPPTTGIGPGLERMAMIFTEQEDIYDVIFFPMMKPLLSDINRAIYGVPDTVEAASAAGAGDVAVSLGEFAALASAGALGRASGPVTARPRARNWPGGAVTWHVEVDGLGAGRMLVAADRAKDAAAAVGAVAGPLKAAGFALE